VNFNAARRERQRDPPRPAPELEGPTAGGQLGQEVDRGLDQLRSNVSAAVSS